MTPPCSVRRPVEDGSAVLMALVVTLFFGALGSSLIAVANSELVLSRRVEEGHQLAYAAESGLEAAARDLETATWNAALGGASSASLWDASAPARPTGEPIDLAARTAALQQEASRQWGTRAPSWRLFARGTLDRFAGAGPIDRSPYVAVWVADDPADADGDPSLDSNGVLTLAAAALGTGRSERLFTMTIAHPPASVTAGQGGIHVVSWQEKR